MNIAYRLVKQFTLNEGRLEFSVSARLNDARLTATQCWLESVLYNLSDEFTDIVIMVKQVEPTGPKSLRLVYVYEFFDRDEGLTSVEIFDRSCILAQRLRSVVSIARTIRKRVTLVSRSAVRASTEKRI